MEIKPGYKQTEVGVIPEDWKVKPLSDLTILMTNGFVGVAKIHYTQSDDGVLYIQGFNVEENRFNFHGIKKVTPEFHRLHSKSCLREGDLLTVQTGDVGLTSIVTKQLKGSNCHALIITRFKKQELYPRFFAYYFNSTQGRARLKELEIGTTMKHINVGDMVGFRVPLPPTLAEQERIAGALSDVDGLIEGLQRLIDKKKLVKQGAMQALLTGRKRLPGFDKGQGYKQTEVGVIPDDWLVTTIGDLFTFKNGLNKAKAYFGYGTPIINYMDVFKCQSLYKKNVLGTVTVSAEEIRAYRVKKGDVFFTRTSETVEEIGLAAVLEEDIEDGVFSGFVLRARPKAHDLKLDLKFKRFCFRSEIVRKQITSRSSYTTRALTNGRLLSRVILPCPSEIKEQEAIATTLSDMDTAIEALEQKLAKYRQIKQGMMQELLTGKTRLVESSQGA